MSAITKPSVFVSLPSELLIHIFGFLSHPADLAAISSVCTLFHHLSNENKIWRRLCMRYFGLTREDCNEKSKYFNRKVCWKCYFRERQSLDEPGSMKWIRIHASDPKRSPPPRYAQTANWCNGKIYIVGGEYVTEKRYNTVLCVDPKTMNIEELPTSGGMIMQPVGRHQSVAYKNKIFVIGGYDGISKFNTLSVFDLQTRQWYRPIPKGDIPEPRSNHSCALIGNTLYMFGGNNTLEDGNYNVLNDFYSLNLETLEWRNLKLREKITGEWPCAKSGHRMVAWDNNLVIFGGGVWNDKIQKWTHKFNDIHLYDTIKKKWLKPPITGVCKSCTFASLIRVGYQLVLFGGQSTENEWTTDTTWILDTISLTWREVVFDSKPRCRDMGSLTLLGRAVTYSPAEKENKIEKTIATSTNMPSFLVSHPTKNNPNSKSKNGATNQQSHRYFDSPPTTSTTGAELKNFNSNNNVTNNETRITLKKTPHRVRYAHLYGGNHGGAVNDSYLLQINWWVSPHDLNDVDLQNEESKLRIETNACCFNETNFDGQSGDD
jgi:N-acetylneuraminic acid mutarotase